MMIRALEPLILFNTRIALRISWSSFRKDQNADPFARSSRVQIHLDEHKNHLGYWSMSLFWDPTHKDYSEMEIGFSFFLVFPFSCELSF